MSFHPFRRFRSNTARQVIGAGFGSVLYNLTLGSARQYEFSHRLIDQWPGNIESGRWLCGGAFAVDEEHVAWQRENWEPFDVSDEWIAHMHGFSWLRDLKTLGGDQARRQAREMVSSWMQRYRGWRPVIWECDIAGERITNWITHYAFFGESADDHFQERFFDCLTRQARHLSRTLPGVSEGLPLLKGIKGLAYAGCAFEEHAAWLDQALNILKAETEKQILSDGGHVSRCPAQLMEALKIYLDIRYALSMAGHGLPEFVQHAIDRMAQAMRFFLYADKKMAVFNGTQEGHFETIDSILAMTDTRGRVLRALPHTGYERVSMGRSLLMVDTGTPPSSLYDQTSHAAPLAMEFSYGKERVFVNCGTHPLDGEWQHMLRATAAHNTLTIDNRNVCEIGAEDHFGRKPGKVTVTREETRDAILLESGHDGYVPLNGVMHKRRFYMSKRGQDLRGEEILACTIGLNKPLEYAVRFHLHPRALVSLIQNDHEALVRLPGGTGWRFFHDGGRLALENSIYLGEGCRPRKTKQLVLYGYMTEDVSSIKWALQREG